LGTWLFRRRYATGHQRRLSIEPSRPDEDFPFKVVRTNGHDEVLARSINLLMGRAAFETAKRLYPKDQLEYRKGAQVLDRSGASGD